MPSSLTDGPFGEIGIVVSYLSCFFALDEY